MITSEIDTDRYEYILMKLQDALLGAGQDAKNLLESETRLLVRKLVNFTPPMKWKGAKGGSNANRAAGEMAVQRDICGLFSEAETKLLDTICSEHGTSNIDGWITAKDGHKVNVQWAKVDWDGSQMSAIHQAERDSRGRVRRATTRSKRGLWFSRAVIPQGMLEPFVKKKQAMVGRWKATWAVVGQRLGDSYPQWITRHFGSPIAGVSRVNMANVGDSSKPFVEFGSSAPGVGRTREDVQRAVNQRGGAMIRRIARILTNYGQDIHAGGHPRPHAKEHEPTLDPVE